MNNWSFLAVFASFAVACGGTSTSGSGSSTVSGTAGGQPVPTIDAIGLVGTQSVQAGTTTITVGYAGVDITNVAGSCSAVQGSHTPRSATALSFVVTTPGGAVATGTYTIGSSSSSQVIADFAATNASCTTTTSETASAGTVSFTTISSALVQGTFDVTMSNGDHLSGSFDAPVCNVNIGNFKAVGTCGS
jgi:hypothetical protein